MRSDTLIPRAGNRSASTAMVVVLPENYRADEGSLRPPAVGGVSCQPLTTDFRGGCCASKAASGSGLWMPKP